MRLCLVALVALGGSCAPDQPPARLEVDTDCDAQYTADTFHPVFANTLSMDCGSDKVSCHSAEGHRGGMSFEDEQTAFDALLDDQFTRVVPGDPGGSEMIIRTSSPGADYQMPPGDALKAAERCSLIKWVLGGALR